ncbi:Uncharacterised protein [Enterobacter hormaechei]|nr:Uncharacterised protein [Enterobacter hormaechei]
MKKALLGSVLALTVASFGASAADMISKDEAGNDSNLLIVFYVQIMPDDFVMQLHRF